MQFGCIGVVGAGTMGNGIAQTLAVAGHTVILTDVAQGALDRALKTIDTSLDRLVKKDKMAAEAKVQALSLIKSSTDLASLGSVDLVVEAATENLALKLDLFARQFFFFFCFCYQASLSHTISLLMLFILIKLLNL